MARQSSQRATRDDLVASFRKKEFSSLYLFYGDEEYFIDEAVTQLIDASVDESSKEFNLDIVYGGETSSDQIAALASSFPMTGDRRVVVVREFDKLSSKEQLIRYAEHAAPSTSLVLVASKPDYRFKIFKVLAEHAVTVEFKSLYESEIPGWIEEQCERKGIPISRAAAELIHSYVGRSLRELRNELEKLWLFIGARTGIDVDDVNAVVGFSKQYNIYELQTSIGAKDFARALEIMEHMLQAGESATGLITMLTRYYGKLWVIVDCLGRKMSSKEIAAALKFKPQQMYYLDGEIRTARRFSSEEIEDGFRALAEADERLKTSAGTVAVIMTVMLHRMFRSQDTEHGIVQYS